METLHPLNSQPSPQPPGPGNHDSTVYFYQFDYSPYLTHRIIQYLSFWVWLISISINVFNVNMKSLSCVRLFATPWTVARQVPLSLGILQQESWSGLPFPSPRRLDDFYFSNTTYFTPDKLFLTSFMLFNKPVE